MNIDKPVEYKTMFGFSLIPSYKKNINHDNPNKYKNIYTFEGYYSKKNYIEIKEIVKNDRVMSVGLDPMVAVMNNIKVIDGYHNLYPAAYKVKFRKVIEKELSKSKLYLKYYDYWGSRVYAFVSDPNNVELDFNAAKKLGAKFIISKYLLSEENNLERMCKNCNTDLYLYKIM